MKIKNILLYLIIIYGAFVPARLFAAQAGGTNPVADGSLFVIATEYDYVFDRSLKSSDMNNGKIKDTSIICARLTYKISSFLAAYARAGAIGNLNMHSELASGKTLIEKYDPGFYGAGGIKAWYELFPSLTVALDNQIAWMYADIDKVEYDSRDSTFQAGHTDGWEYQLAGIVSYRIDYKKILHPVQGEYPHFTPYAGVKYSHLNLDSSVSANGSGFSVTTPHSRKNKDKFGALCGLEMVIPGFEAFVFNIEGRFLDDVAVSGFINYNF